MLKPFEGAGNGCHRLNLSNTLAAGLTALATCLFRALIWNNAVLQSGWWVACGEGSVVGAAMLVRLSHQFQDAAHQDQWYTGNYVKAQGTAHRLMQVLLQILY